jgi:hypothetical protein
VIALLLGTLIALAALSYVLLPLFVGVRRVSRTSIVASEGESDLAVVALREIEFDRATGKLSDVDYAALRERYTAQALESMRRAPAVVADDPVEAAIRAYRVTRRECLTCGPRPEPDATYCSECGSYLPGKCGGCGTAIITPGSRFCTDCGRRLAA